MANLFVRAWKGEASLAKAFWLLYVLGGIIVGIVILLIMSLFIPNLFTPEVYNQYSDEIMAIGFPYSLYSAICVWRCANNSAVFWKWLARIIVVLGVISGILSIIRLI